MSAAGGRGPTWTIMRHEWRVLRREPVAAWAAALLLLAVAYALVVGAAWQEELRAEARATETEGSEWLAEQQAGADSGDFGGLVGGAKTFVALPPGPLAALSVGLADLYPARAEISIWKRPDTLFGRYQLDSPLSLLAGRFDLAFVVLYLLPLFVVVLSYDLLAAERERGTLAMVLMQPVGLGHLLAAKLLARVAWSTAILALGVLAGGWVVGTPASAWPRLLGWFAIAWLYAVFWLALAAWVATLGRRAETCATTLAVAWLAVVLVVPGLLNVAVRAASPTPSRLELVTTMRAASSDASKSSAELLAEYYHEHPELSTNGRQEGFIPAFYAAEREVERRLAPLLAEYDARLAGQQRLVSAWRLLSPAVLANEALIELAGSGLDRQRSAGAQARAFLAEWHEALAPRIFLGQRLSPADYDTLPRFRFVEPPVSTARVALAAAALALLSLVLLELARRRLGTLRVTP